MYGPTAVSQVGEEEQAPGQMSLTIRVPPAVPSVRHSSVPWMPSSNAKYRPLPAWASSVRHVKEPLKSVVLTSFTRAGCGSRAEEEQGRERSSHLKYPFTSTTMSTCPPPFRVGRASRPAGPRVTRALLTRVGPAPKLMVLVPGVGVPEA